MTSSFISARRNETGPRLPYEGGEIGGLPGAGANMSLREVVVALFLIRTAVGLYRGLTKPDVPKSERDVFAKDRPLGTLTGTGYFSDSFNALF